MKELYLKIKALLQTIDGLYVDMDFGQFMMSPPPVNFPAALIDISFPDCQDLTDGTQRVKAVISITLAFSVNNDQTSSLFTADVAAAALAYWDTVTQVYTTLQSYYDDDIEQLSRQKLIPIKSGPGIKLALMPFETYFDDVSAA